MPARFATVGHSNRGMGEFLDILRMAGTGTVIDIRAFAKSRRNAVFNDDRLARTLGEAGIGYRHMPALGGRRARQTGVDPALNAMWRVRSFHNYADYALGGAFAAALAELVAAARDRPLALMCSEALWWRCHRRIVADHLLVHGYPVCHLMGAGRMQRAALTPGARPTAGGRVIYPAAE
ncbi:MAG: DUF488 domain-containing protein [Rhodobacteraceae bacterium]|nr:DUF488 domain-containing protein [Paracoccaceae bacterium]